MKREWVFKSSKTSAMLPTATLHLHFWPDLSSPQIEIWTEDNGGSRLKVGPSIVFRGEEFHAFVSTIDAMRQKP